MNQWVRLGNLNPNDYKEAYLNINTGVIAIFPSVHGPQKHAAFFTMLGQNVRLEALEFTLERERVFKMVTDEQVQSQAIERLER